MKCLIVSVSDFFPQSRALRPLGTKMDRDVTSDHRVAGSSFASCKQFIKCMLRIALHPDLDINGVLARFLVPQMTTALVLPRMSPAS